MEELSVNEVNAVSVAGGDRATAVVYGTGLATSIAIGSALGPFGAGVGAIGFTASFFGSLWFQRWNRA